MTKKDYELIAEGIAQEARATLEVYKMHKAVHDNAERADLATQLQTLWSLSLKMRDKLQKFPRFDEHKFLNACKVSPQNWRYSNWVNGKYINTSGLRITNGN